MSYIHDLSKTNKRLDNKVKRLEKKVYQLLRRMALNKASLDKMKEKKNCAIRQQQL